MRPLLALIAFTILAAGCGGDGDSSGSETTVRIAVNAPFSKTPYVGETIANGAELAAGGPGARVTIKDGTVSFEIRRYDSGLSARKSVQNVRRAIADGAAAIIDEGTGVDASWRLASDADVPICITYQGGEGLVDVDRRPNVFRIAPTDHGISFRLAEYLIPKGLRIALIVDDSTYGQQGSRALGEAFAQNPEAVATRLTVSSGAPDLAPEVLRARRADATALLVWGEPATIAAVIAAARGSGWNVPVYTPATGEDPLVRQQLANHPRWVDGLTFAAGRPTAEVGSGPFLNFQNRFENEFGAQPVGVKTSEGTEVVQPPDYAMYSYDFVNVLAAAIRDAGDMDNKEEILARLNQVSVEGANGDQRGFNERSHEGVVDDDVYFARFMDMTYAPVKDDPLSATLPVIEQRR
jgi:branched-chain amino acid transport system substrate-binding protein